MSAHRCAVRWVTGRFVGVEPTYRDEVAQTAIELGAETGRRDRVAEVAALAGLALRLRRRYRTAGRADRTWRQGLFLGALLLPVAVGAERISSAAGTTVGIAVPGVLLVLGRFDPRLAATALVVWFWRLVVGDFGGFVRALAAPEADMLPLARWCLMASGVAVAWVMTHRSIRRLNGI